MLQARLLLLLSITYALSAMDNVVQPNNKKRNRIEDSLLQEYDAKQRKSIEKEYKKDAFEDELLDKEIKVSVAKVLTQQYGTYLDEAPTGKKTIYEYLIAKQYPENIEKILFNGGVTPLFVAILHGDINGLEKLLLQDEKLVNKCNTTTQSDWYDIEKMSPLSFAIVQSKYEIAKLLLVKGADVNATDEDGNTALHVAVENFNSVGADMVELLMQHGADILAQNNEGDTPLHIAFSENAVYLTSRVVDWLITEKTIGAQNSTGDTPLHILFQHFNPYKDINNLKALDRVIEEATKYNVMSVCNNDGYMPLEVAIEYGNYDVLKYCKKIGYLEDLIKDKYTNKNGDSLLHTAIKAAQVEMMEGSLEIVELLLECGARPSETNKKGESALITAVRLADDYEIIQLLVEKEIELHGDLALVGHQDKNGNTVLHLAAENGDPELVEYLIENGADTDQVNDKGETPLYYLLHGDESDSDESESDDEESLDNQQSEKVVTFSENDTLSDKSTSEKKQETILLSSDMSDSDSW